jgi:ATP-dependent Lhr-like helicase
LQGIEAPLGAWEDEIFPLRLEPYDPDLLDEACLDGTIAWGRLSPPRRLEQWTAASDADSNGLSRSAVIHRAVPASLVHRQDLVWLLPADRAQPVTGLSGAEGDVYQALVAHGALFVQDLAAATGLLPAQVEDSLAMLAALGLVASDGFRGVRRAVDPHRRHTHRLRRRPTRSRALAPGRWSRFPGPLASIKPEVRVERWALQLIERWGVVFKDLLAQESLAPPWWQLRGVYRRMEARGELRGGLFVRGVSGEQYASPEAVDRLRRFRDLPLETQPTVLSAADPLNLTGILDSGPRLPTSMSNALGLLNGRVVGRRLAADVASEGGEDLVRLLRMSAAARRFRDVPVSVG